MGTTTNGFPYPESTDFVTDGAQAIEDLAVQVDAKIGLWLVKEVTVGSVAVSSVTISDCFNADFDDYRIVGTGITCSSTDNLIYARLDNHTSSTYSHSFLGRTYAGASAANQESATNTGLIVGGTSTVTGFSCDIFAPNKATIKKAFGVTSTNNAYFGFGGVDTSATARTGFTIRASVGTFTNGIIRVYGYRS